MKLIKFFTVQREALLVEGSTDVFKHMVWTNFNEPVSTCEY